MKTFYFESLSSRFITSLMEAILPKKNRDQFFLEKTFATQGKNKKILILSLENDAETVKLRQVQIDKQHSGKRTFTQVWVQE